MISFLFQFLVVVAVIDKTSTNWIFQFVDELKVQPNETRSNYKSNLKAEVLGQLQRQFAQKRIFFFEIAAWVVWIYNKCNSLFKTNLVSVRKKKQQNTSLSSWLDDFDQDVFIGGAVNSERRNIVIHNDLIDRDFTVDYIESSVLANEEKISVTGFLWKWLMSLIGSRRLFWQQ